MIACRGVGQERQFLSSHCIFTMATRSSTLPGPGPADSTTTLKNRIFLVRHGLVIKSIITWLLGYCNTTIIKHHMIDSTMFCYL